MKPMIIIPEGLNGKQNTITMTVVDFKKTINDVWEDGYKEGQRDNLITKFINSCDEQNEPKVKNKLASDRKRVFSDITIETEDNNKDIW